MGNLLVIAANPALGFSFRIENVITN